MKLSNGQRAKNDILWVKEEEEEEIKSMAKFLRMMIRQSQKEKKIVAKLNIRTRTISISLNMKCAVVDSVIGRIMLWIWAMGES